MNGNSQHLANTRLSRILGSLPFPDHLPSLFTWDAWRSVLGCDSSGWGWPSGGCGSLWYPVLGHAGREKERRERPRPVAQQGTAPGALSREGLTRLLLRMLSAVGAEHSLLSLLETRASFCALTGRAAGMCQKLRRISGVSAAPEFSSFLAFISSHCCSKSFVWFLVSPLKVSKFQKVVWDVLVSVSPNGSWKETLNSENRAPSQSF